MRDQTNYTEARKNKTLIQFPDLKDFVIENHINPFDIPKDCRPDESDEQRRMFEYG